MPSKEEKERRKQTRKALAKRETEEAFARKPVPDEDLRALFDYLGETLFEEREGAIRVKCDHTLSRSRAFLEQRGLSNIDEICKWFEEYGGYCDCEVVYNVADYWDDKI